MIHAVIMAGGSGTRFWPQSRQDLPKQFLKLSGERTLLQATYDRCLPDIAPERVWVVTNARQAAIAREQVPEIPAEHVLVEPCGRNTAPCIGLATIHLLKQDPEATMVIMPADHVITPADAFRDLVQRAIALTVQNPQRLVLFGVKPSYPATGYGYIERGHSLPDAPHASSVASFREKPDVQTAGQYVESGQFLWNCGVFVWQAATILDELAIHEPTLHTKLQTLREDLGTSQFADRLADEFPRMPSISIDYSVLERSRNICLLEATFDWDDVGSWEALRRLHGQDADGNTILGDHCGVATSDCIVRSDGNHLIATVGVDDLIIVHTADATLVASRGHEDSLRKLVQKLRDSGHERIL